MRLTSLSIIAVFFGQAGFADTLACQVNACDGAESCTAGNTHIAFQIDRNQFIAPQAAGDPPPRKVTTVTMGDTTFPAEPILIDDMRGFWATASSGSDIIFIVRPDGQAIYSKINTGERLTGTCQMMP